MEELKKRRSQIKKAITRIYNVVNNESSSYDEIKVRIEKLDEVYKEYESCQDAIDSLCANDDDQKKEDQYRTQIEEMFFAAKAMWSKQNRESTERTKIESPPASSSINDVALQSIVQQQANTASILEAMSAKLSTVTANQATSATGAISSNCNQYEIKLPPVEIPDFDGDMSNWIRFRDLFVSLIDSKSNISNVQKLEYLQTKLKGEASTIIKHLTPANDNYAVAWKLVKENYDDPNMIVENYLELLLEQKHVKNASANDFRTFYNNTIEAYNALKALKGSLESYDYLIMFLIKKKLDAETLTLWRRQKKDGETQKVPELLKFLKERAFELEEIQKSSTFKAQRQSKSAFVFTKAFACPLCNENHALFSCDQFKSLEVEKRRNFIKENKICFNCIKGNHLSKDCKAGPCKICNQKHNTLLHETPDDHQKENTSASSIVINTNQQVSHHITLLPTAIIMVRDCNNVLQPCRALIDSGAQSALISEACVQRLQLKKAYDKTLLYGVGSQNPNQTKGKVQIEIYCSKYNKTMFVTTYCLSNLTQGLPANTVMSKDLDYFKNLSLADPKFYKKNPIDIILGANVLAHCILEEQKIHPSGSPLAVNTIFGWIIMGNIKDKVESTVFATHVHCNLDAQIQRFWDIEDCTLKEKLLTPEEEKAEEHFKRTVQRQKDGRYIVRLPFKEGEIALGESKQSALKRLQSMERKFQKNESLKSEFTKFMDEYEELNHMEALASEENVCFYLPHHAVLKPSSTTTKLRVVFDASCKSSNNLSLNDHLLVGPTVQNDLFTILLKFRIFEIGFTADVEKMYRQILIHPDDRKFQCILWRKSSKAQLKSYELTTVTYGTASAPFLATRTLQQIAFDSCKSKPDVSFEIQNKFYVDDYMSCAPDINSANQLRNDLCLILKNSGFNLRKWASNSKDFMENIMTEDRAMTSSTFIDCTDTIKTLGLLWNTTTDSFQYSVRFEESLSPVTKRSVLSDISKIYDPIGWLSPVVVKLKIFMQKLWLKGVGWDQELTNPLIDEWLSLKGSVKEITKLEIPRWFEFENGDQIQLHGFSDSSQLAYAAAIYIRIVKPNGNVSTHLLTAKTKIAPIKQISLPRLELCAAHLMVKLIMKVKVILDLKEPTMYGWTDSTIVLAWISDHPVKWKTFIANRAAFIIENLPATQWHHIPSKENPADLATRGISSSTILESELWWRGPHIIQSQKLEFHPHPTLNANVDLDIRKVIATTTLVMPADEGIFNRFSSFSTMLRVTAFMLRFINNCKANKHGTHKLQGFLTTMELERAHILLVLQSQRKTFSSEINSLKIKEALPATHKLACLSPFLDKQGIMRVGGRLTNAKINYDQKHPILLQAKDHLALLLVRDCHFKNLHAGTRQLQYLLGLKYWIPGVIHLIKKVVYQCTSCMRYRQISFRQRMGDLPSYRVQPCLTFTNVGIDFAGPISVRSWRGRGSKTYKCWIALFVCLGTKAIHLEAVTELSTAAFMATLRRFTSRRGKPRHIHTDNGTNFVGCNREMKELFEFLNNNLEALNKEMSHLEIHWHFTPPSGPNFGGLWEAGVKSVKFHLKRVLKNSSVTFEELTTLLCQIECCLNSRPLCLKFDGDADPLTPGHFLTLRQMVLIPDENLSNVSISCLTRWQYMQYMVRQFWNKWSKEYLSQLQRRPKWQQKLNNLQINDMVIIKDDNLPPALWLMGKVIATHPGNDGLVRVATIKTKNGELKRPISKLCPLFLDC